MDWTVNNFRLLAMSRGTRGKILYSKIVDLLHDRFFTSPKTRYCLADLRRYPAALRHANTLGTLKAKAVKVREGRERIIVVISLTGKRIVNMRDWILLAYHPSKGFINMIRQ